ncbi:PREDICTED: uncharacterized protein LOC109581900 [Amphimedon queenslandica]|uniref:Uncharacterized protein n=1 Tax=Amphimedon queenslandica TaxID=400682 RepID=A0A1X7VT48_AMPQE|nr:PREDICTED: uncharacterized protein LOC109581900 [Amphimedon queenslandica]|eukprot:XP_019851935.1 PREDICTED: uncharacterized protein LOC109581900 [Amphimedon queenslandica]
MSCCCAGEGEPTCIYWIGQADTARLKARFWLQYGIINCIVFGICILFTWLVYAFPVIGAILGYIALKKFDDGNEEGCDSYTKYSMIVSIVGTVLCSIFVVLATIGIALNNA